MTDYRNDDAYNGYRRSDTQSRSVAGNYGVKDGADNPYSRNNAGSYSSRSSSYGSGGYEVPRRSRSSRNAYDVYGGGNNGNGRNGKNGKNKKKIVLIVLAVILGIALIAGLAVGLYIKSVNDKLHSGLDQGALNALQPAADDDEYVDGGAPFFCLLMGVDKSIERAEYSGDDWSAYRSDSIILAYVDPNNKQVSLLSMHRDTQIEYNGKLIKLNGVYPQDGPEGMIRQISKMCGNIPITHYAQIDFDHFEDLVDAIGGVEVDVPYTFYDEDAGGGLDAGIQTLNGEQALVLCRARHCYDDMGDGDVFRASNQRLVITAAAKKLLNSDKSTMVGCLNTICEMVMTDMSVNDIITIASAMRGMNTETSMYTAMAPTSGFYENGLWYEKLDSEELLEMVGRMKQGLPPDADQAAAVQAAKDSNSNGDSANSIDRGDYLIKVLNGCAIQGIASKNANSLKAYGYRTSTGDANSSDYDENLIIYNKEADKAVAEDIKSILGGKLIKNDGSYTSDAGDLIVIIGG